MRKVLMAVLFLACSVSAQVVNPSVLPGTPGNCGKYAASGTQITDAGAACGSGSGGIGGTIAANQLVGGTGADTVGPITDGTGTEDVPAAFTMAPILQTFTVQGRDVAAPCVVPVCLDCRKRQMGVVSKTGLAVA